MTQGRTSKPVTKDSSIPAAAAAKQSSGQGLWKQGRYTGRKAQSATMEPPKRPCGKPPLSPPTSPDLVVVNLASFRPLSLQDVVRSPLSSSRCSSIPSPTCPEKHESNVRVALRVRPFIPAEVQRGMATCPPVMDPVGTTLNVQVPNRGISRFTFDSLLWSASQQDVPVATQQDVYTETGVPVVEATFAGYNSCIFAYGQTGSGKTHTMMGGDGDTEKGLLPRVSEEVFQRAQTEYASKTCTFEVSFMEIYCEKVKDLLNSEQCSKDKYDSLKVRQHPVKGVFVDGVRKMSVSTWEDCRKLLQRGARQRVTASTSMNDKSSRSHAIFTLTLTVGETTRMSSSGRVASSQRTSCIHLVDLAGSERVSKTGATGHLLEEATQINLSLTVLRKVIDALVERSLGGSGKGSARLLPVRESMLTWILSDSLGGNSKTTMIATVSPSPDNIEETISTLRYAVKARSIVNMTKVNEDSHARIVRDLQTELQKLKSEQQDRTNDTYVLADQIKLNEEALAEVKRAALATANQHMKLLEEERTKRHNAEEEIKKLTQRLHNVQRALLIREAALKGVQDQESRCSLCSVM